MPVLQDSMIVPSSITWFWRHEETGTAVNYLNTRGLRPTVGLSRPTQELLVISIFPEKHDVSRGRWKWQVIIAEDEEYGRHWNVRPRVVTSTQHARDRSDRWGWALFLKAWPGWACMGELGFAVCGQIFYGAQLEEKIKKLRLLEIVSRPKMFFTQKRMVLQMRWRRTCPNRYTRDYDALQSQVYMRMRD